MQCLENGEEKKEKDVKEEESKRFAEETAEGCCCYLNEESIIRASLCFCSSSATLYHLHKMHLD